MKNHLTSLSLFFLLFISCHNTERTANKLIPKEIKRNDTITISLDKLKSRGALYLRYSDDIGNEMHYLYDKNASKQVTQKIISKAPVIFHDDDVLGQGTMYVLLGGDSITIAEAPNDKLLKFSTKNSVRNNELNFFRAMNNNLENFNYFKLSKGVQLLDPLNQVFTEMFIFYKSTDYDFAAKYANTKYHDQLVFLNDYVKKYPVSAEMKNFFADLIYFHYAEYKFRVAFGIANSNKKLDSSIVKDITLFKQKINNPHFKCMPDFMTSLQYYFNYLTIINKQKNIPVNELIKQNFNGAAKDYLLFYTINRVINKQKYDPELLKSFYKDCGNPAYVAEINRIAGMLTPGKQTLLSDNAGSKKTFEDLIAQNKGKVLYIDFWASWCVPCIEQMPYSAKLHGELKNYPIRFLYFSMDNSFSSWQTVSKQLKHNNADNFLVANSFNSLLASSFKLTTIPRYIIINKAGTMVSAEGYEPSGKSTKDFLLKLAKE